MRDATTYPTGGPVMASAGYGVMGEMTSFNGDTRTYKSLGQLTRITGGGIDIEYQYMSGLNNGRIYQQKDWVSGEQVSYGYDSLNRLVSATTADNSWTANYTYDGWGNLGGADPATNRAGGPGWDANGNTGVPGNCIGGCVVYPYDVENRLLTNSGYDPGDGAGPGGWSYDGSGKRVFWYRAGVIGQGVNQDRACEVYFYGITGQRLATYSCGYHNVDGSFWIHLKNRNLYFAGKIVQSGGVGVTTDRLGSVRANANGERFNYRPYGAEGTPTADGREKFGTYFRDQGLDYADQRYYDYNGGRFKTVDPGGLDTAIIEDPGSWNRYAYTRGDPINRFDPEGLYDEDTNCTWDTKSNTLACPTPRRGQPGKSEPVRHDPIIPTLGLPHNSGGARRDPKPTSIEFGKAVADGIRAMKLDDCHATAAFADAMAGTYSGNDFINGFGAITPEGFGVPGTKIDHNLGTPGGFKPSFQDSDDGSEQSHHFGYYFQLGAAYAPVFAALPGSAEAASVLGELMQGQNTNWGDMALEALAAELGAVVKLGIVSAKDVGGIIRDMCQ